MCYCIAWQPVIVVLMVVSERLGLLWGRLRAVGEGVNPAIGILLVQLYRKAPEFMQMFEHLFMGCGQRNALVGGIAQGQRAIAADGDVVDLDIGLMLAQIVLGGQLLA